jgi:hypothetical protein
MEVTTFALPPKPNLNAELIETLGARYLSTHEVPILAGAELAGLEYYAQLFEKLKTARDAIKVFCKVAEI